MCCELFYFVINRLLTKKKKKKKIDAGKKKKVPTNDYYLNISTCIVALKSQSTVPLTQIFSNYDFFKIKTNPKRSMKMHAKTKKWQ